MKLLSFSAGGKWSHAACPGVYSRFQRGRLCAVPGRHLNPSSRTDGFYKVPLVASSAGVPRVSSTLGSRLKEYGKSLLHRLGWHGVAMLEVWHVLLRSASFFSFVADLLRHSVKSNSLWNDLKPSVLESLTHVQARSGKRICSSRLPFSPRTAGPYPDQLGYSGSQEGRM